MSMPIFFEGRVYGFVRTSELKFERKK